MHQIDNEKFGQFLSDLRKEKSMTQKELADKLFVSDKTVSKWERGNSMPNVTLLIPIADVLGITVTELLQGEKLRSTDAAEATAANPLARSVRSSLHRRKRMWISAFLVSIGIVTAEAILMLASGMPIAQMGDSLYASFVMLLFAGGLCLFVKEILPSYYDRDRINFVSQGVLRIHMPGLAFNNGNWIYVLTVFRVFSLSTAILLPALCCICISIGGAELWESVRYVSVVILSAGLITATYAVGEEV